MLEKNCNNCKFNEDCKKYVIQDFWKSVNDLIERKVKISYCSAWKEK